MFVTCGAESRDGCASRGQRIRGQVSSRLPVFWLTLFFRHVKAVQALRRTVQEKKKEEEEKKAKYKGNVMSFFFKCRFVWRKTFVLAR